ncbi:MULTISPECIES: phage portal protein [unclassified Sulfitobacter]|jgi:HK97 family phage portal protein|uniref:phage portal protein n=1 Tax=unclassified Sulfitobacter TaxID=196795 RepID=UPI0007C3B863|nr:MULTISPECIES: phage portal protein [unclassified Sulfitobacter]KZY05273.1 phage portal protein [Sulfitobacter sp. HI0023]KZY26843.1 phage portal protein [Sulfitobacter sp. HI0040]KZZ67773.1 phage portal protein [Sulfitobacter sp. HI0129]
MGFFQWLQGGPKAAVQSADGGRIVTARDIEEAIRTANTGTNAGVSVTPHSAMQVSAVYACVRIISGAVANLPLHVKRRVSDKVREDAADTALWTVLRRKPNGWQTPSQFRRQMQAQILLRGNAYAIIAWSRNRVVSVVPLDPDRMEVKQADSGEIQYTYTRRNGSRIGLPPREVFHLVGMTLDGVTGVSPITFARETIGLSMAQERHGSTTFKNSARPSMVLQHPAKIGSEGVEFLRASLENYRSGGESEGKALILEEGMEARPLSMTAEDAQWIESRKFSRSDIAMFFGVPPHMIGDTEKSTSWGSGIEQQSIGFVTYTLEDHLTAWEETINRDLVADDDSEIYARFNRAALVRGDMKTRWESYVKGLQWGVMSPDEVRALEDLNPREDGEGGQYYDPPNTAGGDNGDSNEPEEPTAS